VGIDLRTEVRMEKGRDKHSKSSDRLAEARETRGRGLINGVLGANKLLKSENGSPLRGTFVSRGKVEH